MDVVAATFATRLDGCARAWATSAGGSFLSDVDRDYDTALLPIWRSADVAMRGWISCHEE